MAILAKKKKTFPENFAMNRATCSHSSINFFFFNGLKNYYISKDVWLTITFYFNYILYEASQPKIISKFYFFGRKLRCYSDKKTKRFKLEKRDRRCCMASIK